MDKELVVIFLLMACLILISLSKGFPLLQTLALARGVASRTASSRLRFYEIPDVPGRRSGGCNITAEHLATLAQNSQSLPIRGGAIDPETGKRLPSTWLGYVPIRGIVVDQSGQPREAKGMDANRAPVINISQSGKTVLIKFDNKEHRKKYQRRSINEVRYDKRIREVSF